MFVNCWKKINKEEFEVEIDETWGANYYEIYAICEETLLINVMDDDHDVQNQFEIRKEDYKYFKETFEKAE